MFQKLEQARLKLKPSKCELFHRQITYLGHTVSAQGIETDEGKIDAIRKWPTPTTITKVQKFSWVHGILLPVHPQVCAGSPTPA